MDSPAYHQPAPVQVIRDKRGVIVGRIESQKNSGLVIARDVHAIVVGRYNAREGVTRDASGRAIARGNVLSALLFGPR